MRYHPLTGSDRSAMLGKVGVDGMDALFKDVPGSAVVPLSAFDLADGQGELEVERKLSRLAAKNTAAGAGPSFLGAGAYKHHVPAAVDHLIQRSEFLTSYTPYQPEIAQGTLQYMFEFQTQVALLTGMEIANASMYDGSTATAEARADAVLMAMRITRRSKAILSGGLHPHYAETVETVAALSGTVARAPVTPGRAEDIAALIDGDTACVVVQSPERLRPDPRSQAHRRRCARQGGAADRRGDRSGFARPARSPRLPGRRHRRLRGPVDRQRAEFRAAPMSGSSPRARNSCARCPAA